MRLFVLLLTLLFLSCSGKSGIADKPDAPFPRVGKAPAGPAPAEIARQSAVFFNDEVHEVRITIDETLFARQVQQGERGGGYARAALLEFDGEPLADVGIRVRGSRWSRRLAKKQYKLDFSPKKLITGADGTVKKFSHGKRRFHGLAKLNLRCNADNDPALLTDKLTSEVFLAAGALYPRTGMARLWINGQYQGVYLLTEHPDATMLRVRLGDGRGNQFKGRWRGGDAMNLYPDRFDAGRYKAVRKINGGNWQDLKRFLEALAQADNFAKFSALVDVDTFIAYWAAAVTAGHWDSLIGNKQNDHIFHSAATGRWHIVCWDGDNSFGIGERKRWAPFAVSTTAPLLDAFDSREKTLLFRQAHAIPALVKLYKNKVKTLLDSAFAAGPLQARIDLLAGKLRPFLAAEPAGTSCLNAAAFETAIRETKDYVARRYAFLKAALEAK